MTKFLFIGATFFLATSTCFSQTTVITENFQNGFPSNWINLKADQNTTDPSVVKFKDGWATLVDPSNPQDTIIGSTSYFTPVAQANRYLITPPLALGKFGNFITWNARSQDPSFPDSYLVMASSTGTAASDFTDTLGIYLDETEDWKTHEIDLSKLGYVDTKIRIAFWHRSTNRFLIYLDDITVRKDDPVSTPLLTKSDISVYPNPFTNELKIQISAPALVTINDLNGNIQQIVELNESKILNTNNLSSGIYIVSVTTNEGIYTQKVVKL